ncbi:MULTISPECIES: hypothetical protein [Bacillaceae]|uniref:Uncharacterized protein n=1 Tax=Gottfriedia luciferensis TaxID=178774 RepID=A0ABX2ZXE0_9BACI|nr:MULTISPECIES: hypothetical protein [Bacillaceae]ODG93325.1 hypothetical protein BED47_03280 [Gottfriedia luciferensis]PGZ95020.1 hypothetical protein COE53_00230 [Bacillus sp. AFS029533]
MKKAIGGLILTGLLTLGVATSGAQAAVNFDSTTGTGFVGKGDVQLAFNWNNASLQKNAGATTFTYDVKDTYVVTEYWETLTGGKQPKIVTHEIEVPKHASVSANVDYDARRANQINGFIIKGFGNVVTEGTVPVVGDPLTGNREVYDTEAGEWVHATVTAVEKTKSEGGLFVNFNGTRIAMPNTPVNPIVIQ